MSTDTKPRLYPMLEWPQQPLFSAGKDLVSPQNCPDRYVNSQKSISINSSQEESQLSNDCGSVYVPIPTKQSPEVLPNRIKMSPANGCVICMFLIKPIIFLKLKISAII